MFTNRLLLQMPLFLRDWICANANDPVEDFLPTLQNQAAAATEQTSRKQPLFVGVLAAAVTVALATAVAMRTDISSILVNTNVCAFEDVLGSTRNPAVAGDNAVLLRVMILFAEKWSRFRRLKVMT